MIAAVLTAAAVSAAGCGGAAKPAARRTTSPSPLRSPFTYNASRPLGVRARLINHGHALRVYDVSYRSPLGGRVPAYLIVPPGAGRHPAIIYLHGAGGDRQDLLLPALWMAARGAVGLTIDSADARLTSPPASGGRAELRQQRALEVQTVVDLRRGVDLLQARPDVDPARIGFVGVSAGAHSGAILAGVDARVGVVDLMSGGAVPMEQYLAAAPPSLRTAVGHDLGAIDPLRYLPRSRSTLLFQDGETDGVLPRSVLETLIRAAPAGATVRWYASGHAPTQATYHDALRWLSEHLGLDGPIVPGVPAGP